MNGPIRLSREEQANVSGKLFTASAEDLEAVYPKLPDFRRLLEKLDGAGKFGNEFIARYVSGAAGSQPGT